MNSRLAVPGKDGSALQREGGHAMLRILGWVIGIIFLIGLLVVFGVLDLIF
ncbi:hypothetical protein RC1_0020 [Rhodospirillum centenum SW]|uniref:Uncharacterized protein n=1 Tax=Rhodospirillum centenum (strain ATCC 51521 / SW) TaxID=414684 RepID=B6IPT5_RHOCS|nr:hypothetical protein RC1_0020 [Rhodospirillum centenum SW]